MLLVGWIGCPQCDYRQRVCVEVDHWLPDSPGAILMCCPNDNSVHRCSMLHFNPVNQCPPELVVSKVTNFAPHETKAETEPPRPWWKFWL